MPCLVDELGVAPDAVGALPRQCAALNRGYLNVVDLTVAAAVEGDPRLVRQAAMVDPNTSATLSPPEIWALCDDMVAAHGDRASEAAAEPHLSPRRSMMSIRLPVAESASASSGRLPLRRMALAQHRAWPPAGAVTTTPTSRSTRRLTSR